MHAANFGAIDDPRFFLWHDFVNDVREDWLDCP